MSQKLLRIGEVAAQTGVSIDSLRYYERRGLLARAVRSAGGYRLFTLETIERVLFIRQAQELNFSLKEISALLTSGDAGECRQVHSMLHCKLADFDARMKAIKQFRRVLAYHLSQCERELKEHGNMASCPVVAFSKHQRHKRAQSV
ncbi:MAG: MerR family transcriptional regulator [Pyrinomonadaceae bacterium]